MDELRPSFEWALIFKDKIEILDHDGWDRMNFDQSFGEPISLKEFKRRAAESTSIIKDFSFFE